jgi:hypothetical protein
VAGAHLLCHAVLCAAFLAALASFGVSGPQCFSARVSAARRSPAAAAALLRTEKCGMVAVALHPVQLLLLLLLLQLWPAQ